MLANPYAAGYTTADLHQVLDGKIDEGAVAGKHVMLLGELTHLKYVAARERLLSLGARSVRNWTPTGFTLNADRPSSGSFSASAPASDAAVQLSEDSTKDESGPDTKSDGVSGSNLGKEPRAARLDLAAKVRQYVESLKLDESLLLRRNELVRVGQRIIQVSCEIADQDGDLEVHHRGFLDESSQAVGTGTVTELAGHSIHIFVAEPRKLTITNFLGVQGTIAIDFRQDLPRGLIFLVGDDGSGKSTLVEAMVWCQFGRCIRSGLAANDVVNDNVGKNCSVMLEFANGYTIARYRKHKSYGNRVVISLHGEPQPQFEHPGSRATQRTINELLGTDYETYVRTVVVSQECVASFLNSTPAQQRDLIEASLGLPILDQCGQLSELLVKNIDNDIDEVEGELKGLLRTKELSQQRLEDLGRARKEAEEAVATLKTAIQGHTDSEKQIDGQGYSSEELIPFRHEHSEIDTSIADREREISRFHDQLEIERENLQRLDDRIEEQMHARPTSWLGQAQRQTSQRLETIAAAHSMGLYLLLRAVEASILFLLLMVINRLLDVSGILRDGSQDHNQEAAINCIRDDIRNSASRVQNLVQQLVTRKQHEVATYTSLVEEEQSSLHSIRSKRDALATKLQGLAADRELFAFWSSALAKRTRCTSSSSSTTSTAKATAGFREHVLVKSLSEPNAHLAQILIVLYDNTSHGHVMATGMPRSLFDSEFVDAMANTSFSSPGCVHPKPAHGERSGGESKRIDLALFFALLQLTWARSEHRARYVLIDEAFDSLDEAVQAAAVRWCGLISQTMADWILMITRSQFLVEQDPGADADEAVVVSAKMGQKGTELVVDGRRIGD